MRYYFHWLDLTKLNHQTSRILFILVLGIIILNYWKVLPTQALIPEPTPKDNSAKSTQPKKSATKTLPTLHILRPHLKHHAKTLTTQSKGILPDAKESIDQLEEAVGWSEVLPNSNEPISPQEAIALKQELLNLIGRVESAHLAASTRAATIAKTTGRPVAENKSAKLVATILNIGFSDLKHTLDRAKEVAKNIPILRQRKNYALLRQQWLQAKAELWEQFPINQPLATGEIRSVWLDRGTIVKAGNEAKLGEIFDSLAQAGINTVFFETVNASYPIYPSRVAPQQNPLIKNWDPLASAVKLAHERGMELHAWVWTFAAANEHLNQILNLPINYPGPVLDAHPDWANYDNAGNMIPLGQTKAFFDPANPELRKYLLNLFAEIVTRYQVDGLQLDYIRYPFQDPEAGRVYGYGEAAREQFQQRYDIDPLDIPVADHQLWEKWTGFRTYQVDTFVTEVSKMLHKTRQDLLLSVAVFPLPEAQRVEKIQQHWEFWARSGDIDLIIPMTYALDTPRFQRLAQPWINSTQLGSTLLVPGIRLLSLPEMEAFDQLQFIRDSPAIGYSLFAAANFNDKLGEILHHTQGESQNSGHSDPQPTPQRRPFHTAVYRYNTLQAEWQFAQENGQLQMSETSFLEFSSRAKELQTALNQVVESPSRHNLILARNVLHRFQAQFEGWMQVEAKENPHQVKAWENHLVTIERLLLYGERHANLEPRV